MDWLGDPMLVNNGIMLMKAGQPAIEHVMQHIALYYAHVAFNVATKAAEVKSLMAVLFSRPG